MSKVVGFVLLLIGLLVGPGATRSAEANCVLTSAGGVKCWGSNLGDGTLNTSATPVDVPGLTSGVIQITDGSGGHTCVLTAAGGVKCWGFNQSGQLGNGTFTSVYPFIVPSPVDVVGLSSGVVQIAAGREHTCAMTAMGTVKCWGRNGNGELGTGTSGPSAPMPVDVTGLTDVAQVSAGWAFTCALSTSGGVKCWGWNDKGQLGDDSVTGSAPFFKTTPVDVVGLTSGVVQISSISGYTCALTSAGGVKCWGDNLVGQIGTRNSNPFYFDQPHDIPTLTSGVAQVSVSGLHNCVVTTSGGAKCWGQNLSGQVGDGTFQFAIACCSVDPPVDVIGLTSGVAQITTHGAPASSLSSSASISCALTTDGAVKCWGTNNLGQLGNGTTTPSPPGAIPTPVDVVGLSSGVAALWDQAPLQEPTDEFTICAGEGGFCGFTGTMDVRYGANGLFSFKTLTDGTACTNEVFGDPAPDTPKQCAIRTPSTSPPPPGDWVFCATEGGECAFSGTMNVRYGANDSFVVKTLADGTPCTNAVFGDPAPDTPKHCAIQPPSTPPPSGDWTFCTTEGGFCAFTGTMPVRYGANGLFVVKTLTDGTACTNEVFGDPAPDVAKSCSLPLTGP